MKRFTPFVLALLLAAAPAEGPLPEVVPNDNRVPAGEMRGDTLVLQLTTTMARWYPETDDGPWAEVPAVAVEGETPTIPSPLIRVREGTVIDVTVTNELPDSAITIQGLATRPVARGDSVVVAPGESHRFVFEAGAPGTYAYWMRPGEIDFDLAERETMVGALIVDAEGAPADDRVFVMNIWGDAIMEPDSTGADAPVGYRNALAINGRSFPFNERIEATVGETQRWRVVNGTIRVHPMHLHGFYFDIERRGSLWADSGYVADDVRRAVTEDMNRFQTMDISWTPDRDGSWLFHCHIGFHMTPQFARLDPPEDDHGHDVEDMASHMVGLVLGIDVRYPEGMSAPPRGEARRLRLYVQEGEPRGPAPRALGYVLQEGDEPPAPDSVVISGPPILVTRDEPTDILVINRMGEPTGVHWHGLELESWSDGVPGWSGEDGRRAPAIMPADSFLARLTLPRAGTFMYHTHLNDIEQLTSGLYGPLVVLEPGETFDPLRDHIYMVGWNGEGETGPPFLVNDAFESPPELEVPAGPHRFRLLNMGPAARLTYSLLRDGEPVTWRAQARDGAALPEHQRVEGEARLRINVGETADVTAELEPGDYEMVVEHPQGAPRWYVQRIVVR